MGLTGIIDDVKAAHDEDESLDEMIVRYDTKIIVLHWLVIIFFIPLAYSGLLMLRDWFLRTFNIFGGDLLLDSFDGMVEVHVYSGLALITLGLIHVLVHLRQKEKHILPEDVAAEFKASLETLMYVTLVSRQKETGSASKYKANQRMAYLATMYTIALSALTAVFIFRLHETGSALHVVAGSLVGLLSIYRILYLVREWDGISLKCILWSGKMPMWYIKEEHYNWYLELTGAKEVLPEVEAEVEPPKIPAPSD
jgi:cytochrome b subunit of formate dehydrogenase